MCFLHIVKLNFQQHKTQRDFVLLLKKTPLYTEQSRQLEYKMERLYCLRSESVKGSVSRDFRPPFFFMI